MSGTTSIEELLSHHREKSSSSRKDKIITIAGLVCSNMAIALLVFSLVQTDKPQPKSKTWSIRAGHTLIKIPLETYLPIPGKPGQLAVSIFGPKKELLIPKAYIHFSDDNIQKSSRLSLYEQHLSDYILELPVSGLSLLISKQNIKLRAYPYSSKLVVKKTNTVKEKSYEVLF
jgi:hypothetical protein